MALPNESQRPFRLYVTHVDGEAHFLKLSGQLDQEASLMIESLFENARENLEQGIGAAPPAAIQEGVICAAKYKDGSYYRARVINISNLANGLVGVQFIDYGNKNVISLSTIRLLDNYDPMFLKLPGQATDYYLSRVISPSGKWDEPIILKLQGLLCYSEYPATIDAQTRTLPIISIQYKGNDLSTHLVSNRIGVALPVQKQEIILLQMTENQHRIAWTPPVTTEAPPYYPEHVPFLINQNFPNPASAMRMTQNVPLPFNGAPIHAPSNISQRLLVNKVSRNAVNLRAPERQPHIHTPMSPQIQPAPPSPKKSATYKSRNLEVNTEHKVYVSYAEEGPELFAVQLVVDAAKLQDMMDDINRRPHSSLAEPPMIGTVCLGRMSGDRIICRAIVTNLSGSQCKLFFVDFGDTEMVSYYDIFDIPEEFVKPHVLAIRFCLSKVKKLNKGPHLNEVFKQLVDGKVLTLKVVPPEGPPLIQYGELYLDNQNVLDILLANMKDNIQFKWIEILPKGSKKSVLVSYVDSCVKFYIQLSENIDALNAVMDAVKAHCKNSNSPGQLPVGAVCCARFPDDDEWYRAMVRVSQGNQVTVVYVDYGNEQEVNVSDLRTITPELIKLPAQAMKCALKGFENKPIEKQNSNQLEMLALEKTLMAHIDGHLTSDTMLVTLIDDTTTPPLDVAKRMMQLSQPRSNLESKAPPMRKESQENFSSPESVVSDEGRRGYRREKSFKDDRRDDEFGQRGGSFRSRETKDGFERSGAGRHSDKRQDRGDRRKPRDNASGDDWEESAAPSVRQNRDNRKKSKDQQEKGKNWKKDLGGVGKRLKQAAEAAHAHANASQAHANSSHAHANASAPANAKTSVQDRLKRDSRGKNPHWGNNQNEANGEDERRDNWGNKKENWGEKKERWGDKKDSWGDKKESWGDKKDSWGDKKDSWGDKKESWGEKKESWGDRGRGDNEGWNQNREFRDSRSDRGVRSDRGGRGGRSDRGGRGGRSDMNPRERADRSYGSEGDNRSERSFKSEGSRGRGRGGRPYQPRAPQFKELPNPVSLDTPFPEATVEIGSQQEVSVTWIVSPENFHTQILSLQSKFLEMMHTIPELYKGVRSYTGPIQVGNSVLARYPSDGVLYRATIVSVQPFSKFIVRYIDFGNKQLVDAKDIWQLDSQLMELPKMAVHCSLLGVAPVDGEWKANPDIDLCFNAPRYQCVFQECIEDQYKVYLWNNGVSVADTLVEKNLAVSADNQSAVTLKDEPIDLTIIVGQQINCRVTHVESFEKFYVQLDLDKAALVENSMAEYDASKLQQIPTESLASGLDCTVKYDGKLYRAILSDVADHSAVRAVLPDYGNEITTAAENFMIMPTELSVYYYQSLECCLNNYSSESEKLMTLDELKQKLIGNKFIIYINYIDGIRLVSTLYEPTGAKVPIFTPDEGAYDSVVPLCARAVFNYTHGVVYVTHVQSLSEVYLQKAGDEAKLTEMLDTLYKYYEEGTPEALTNPGIEGLCAAKSADGNWYRATITGLTDTEATVQFSDYGNSETVPRESLQVLDPKFYEPCALALVASLGLTAVRDDAVEKLKELTTEKELQATLAFGDDCWLTNLHLDGVDVSLQLISENFAAPQLASEKETTAEAAAPTEEPISLPEGCTQVYISHIDSPGQFWLQMADKVNAIEDIQAELQANANNYPDVDTREMGTICVAKYSADDQWYRAEILDSDTDITTVRFIDYGNTDVLDNQPELIKSIPDQFKDVEKYAIRASVNAIPTGTGQWSEPASECFTQLVGDMSAPVDAMVVLKDVTTYVDIYVNGQNLTDKLVSEGHATRSEEAECGGDLPSCFASHVNSPSEFWIQLESAAPELQAVEAAMVDAENFPALDEKEEGVICAAKYPEDGAWYRAQIIVDGSEGTEVLFMDYGNASITNELRNMPEELKTKPALSRKCALQKPRDVKSWSRKSEVKFNELAAEGATIFNVQFIAAGDISIVELYLDGKSVTEELVGLCEEQPPTERPTPVGQDIHSSGKISYANALDEFYIHLDDSTSNIDKVTQALANAESFEPTTELKVGSLCAAFWTEDEQWYRAKILEFCDVGYHVQFIDYGNKAKCEDFRQLPENLSEIEPLAKCCRLAGFVDDPSNESAKSKLNDLVEELVTFQIEFLDSLKEPFLVKLLLNDTDLSTVLKAEDLDANSEPQNEENGYDESEILNASLDSAKTVVENTSFKEETSIVKDLEVSENSDKVLEAETNLETDTKLDTTPDTDATEVNVEQEKLNTSSSDDASKAETVSNSEGKDIDKEYTTENKTNEKNNIKTSETKTNEVNTEISEAKTSEDNITTPDTKTNEDDIQKPLDTAAKDASSDSLNTDTGYTSETLSPDKEIESKPSEKEMSPDKGIEIESKDTSPNKTVSNSEGKDIDKDNTTENKTNEENNIKTSETKSDEVNNTEISETKTKTSEDNITITLDTKTNEDDIPKPLDTAAKDASSDSLNTDTSETLPDKEIEPKTSEKEMSPDKGIEIESKETSPNNTVELNEKKTTSEAKSNDSIKTQ